MRRRVLILHADIYSSPGAEAAHYSRIVERNPAFDFHYPSVGSDLAPGIRRQLPSNAVPFIYSNQLDLAPTLGDLSGFQWIDRQYVSIIACAAAAVQGMVFNAVDLPSSFPVCHLIRPVFSAFGVVVEKIAMGLVGSPSHSLTAANDAEPDLAILDALERAEEAAAVAADVRYSFFHSARATENRLNGPISVIDPHDLISSIAPPPLRLPGRGKPDLWYVGPLHEPKAPELFIELVAGIDRHCFHSLFFADVTNRLPGNTRGSERLIDLAKRKGVTTQYVGRMSRKDMQERIYSCRSVVVAMPSFFDPFCFAAIDAIQSGCPVLLSERTGAFEFLKANHPEHLPSPMDPDNVARTIPTLQHLIENYPKIAKARRRAVRNHPFPIGREGFMEDIYESPVKRAKGASSRTRGLTAAISAGLPLLSAPIREWHPRRVDSASCVSVVIPTRNRPEELARTLINLVHSGPKLEAVVVDNGSLHASRTRTVVESFAPLARLIRIARSDEAIAINCGLDATRGEFVCIFADTNLVSPDLIGVAVEALETHPEVVGVYPDWGLLDEDGLLMESKDLPEFDRELMLQTHWCIPGPGTIARRATVERVAGLDATFRYLSIFDLWLRMTRIGPLLRIPHRLAYAMREYSSAVSECDLASLADEHLRVVEMQCEHREVPGHVEDNSARAMAAAHMTAAAVLGTASPAVAIDHLLKASHLDRSLFDALPPNLGELAGEWPQNWRTAVVRPLVSIVIPVYNGANFLADAIDSALAQTYSNIEVLVVDDGSNDGGATAAVAARYGGRIRYVYQSNGGVAAALNRGIELMRGEFFSWLSHDDMYLPDKVERQVNSYFEFGQRCIIIGDFEAVREDGQTFRGTTEGHNLIEKPLEAVFKGLINGCALLVPRSLFEEVGLFDSGLPTTQDYYLWYWMARKVPFVQCFHPDVRQRLHALQGSRQSSHLEEAGRMFIHLLEQTPADIMHSYSGSEARFLINLKPNLSVYPAARAYFDRRVRELFRRDFRYAVLILADSHARMAACALERFKCFEVPPAECMLVDHGDRSPGGAAELVRWAGSAVTSDWILIQSARRAFEEEQFLNLLEQLSASGANIAYPAYDDDISQPHGLMLRRDAGAEVASVLATSAGISAAAGSFCYQLQKPLRRAPERLTAALAGTETISYSEGIDDTDFLAAISQGFVEGRPLFLLIVNSRLRESQTRFSRFSRALSRHANVLVAYGTEDSIRLSRSSDFLAGGIVFDWTSDRADLVRLLQMACLAGIDVHSVIGFEAHAETFLKALGLPYDVTILNYHLFARDPDFADASGRFVGDHALCPDEHEMLRSQPHALALNAARIITPSRDAAARIRRIAPGLPVSVPEHWDRPAMTVRHVFLPEIREGEPLRVIIPGCIDNKEGGEVVVAAAKLVKRSKLPVRFEVLGEFLLYPSLITTAGETLVQLGPYDRDNFAAKLSAAAPHLAWLPTQVPETWCDVLSDLFSLAIPVAASSIGAVSERCHGRAATWLLPYDATPEMWIDLFLRLHSSKLTLPPMWPSLDELPPAHPFYFDAYLEPVTR